MKKVLFLVALFFVGNAAFAQTQKIAFVNIQAIVDTLPARDSVDMKLAMMAQEYEGAIKNLQAEIQAKEQEYQAKAASGASKATLELIQKSYERLMQDYQETQQTAQRDLQAQQANLYKPLIEKIKVAAGNVAKAKGYSHVMNNAGELVLWSANDKDDITGAVIDSLLKK